MSNPESLAGDLAAFSNSQGGRIIIGVDDQGGLVGLSPDDVRRINQLVSNTAANQVYPSVNPTTQNLSADEGRIIVVVTVPEGISKPYCDNRGVFWVKSEADKRRVTSREEIQRLLQSASLVHADEVVVQSATAAEIDLDHFRGFFEKQYAVSLNEVFERDRISLDRMLQNLALAREGTLNLAGLMLFGRHPQRFRPAFMAKAVAFVGDDLASFATKELPYRGIGTGICRALASVSTLELESNHDQNLFTAKIPRQP